SSVMLTWLPPEVARVSVALPFSAGTQVQFCRNSPFQELKLPPWPQGTVTSASGISVVLLPVSVKDAPVTRTGFLVFWNSQVEVKVPVGPSTSMPTLPSRLEAQALATELVVPRAISMWSGLA